MELEPDTLPQRQASLQEIGHQLREFLAAHHRGGARTAADQAYVSEGRRSLTRALPIHAAGAASAERRRCRRSSARGSADKSALRDSGSAAKAMVAFAPTRSKYAR